MKLSHALILNPSASITLQDNGSLVILNCKNHLMVPDELPAQHLCVRLLTKESITEEALVDTVCQQYGESMTPHVYFLLQKLNELHAISYVFVYQGKTIAMLHPCHGYKHKEQVVLMDVKYKISRFANIQRTEDNWLISCPLNNARLEVLDHGLMTVLLLLSKSKSISDLTQESALERELVEQFLYLLTLSGGVDKCDRNNTLPEDHNEALRQWESHDLSFHTQSRIGRHYGSYGGTFRFKDKIAPLPIIADSRSTLIPLKKPDLSASPKNNKTYFDVLESRCSIRNHGNIPITVDLLSELLYRVARIKEIRKKNNHAVAFSNTPHGGAISELTIYPLIHNCTAIESGLYRYNSYEHGLEKIQSATPDTEQLLKDAQITLQMATYPQILLVITARFQRVSWKYQSMSYSVTLKNVGVLIQNLYLTATAMELAPCALGGGDSDLFAKAAKLNYYEETSVGEFALGSRAY